MFTSPASIALSAFFAFTGVIISVYQILCHLRNYTEPVFQRYIIRIIFMVPVYAIGSFCSLRWREGAIYFDTIRDCYEAWIIYNFSSLLLAYVGGPGAVVVKAEGKQVHPSWAHMTCCLPTMQVDGFFLRRCKQGTLQFVLLKPVMATLTVILYAAGAYTDGDMSPSNGYFYISILYNVCYTFALYGLLLFWIGATELLQPFNPLLKFVLVKTVVFLTFWQGIAISYINSMGEISDPEDGKALQNFMICVEMALAGISLLFAFPHKEYQIGGSTAGWRADAFTHAISIKDVISDTIHVFAPSYSDYVLYSDGGPADNVKRKKYRGQKGSAGEHPKASLVRNMEKGVLADDDEPGGRHSKTPTSHAVKKLEAQRNQAILLDSDSDGIDSEDEQAQIGHELSDESDCDTVSNMAIGTARHARIRTATSAASDDGDGPGEEPALDGSAAASSRRVTQQRSSSRRFKLKGSARRSSEGGNRAGGSVECGEAEGEAAAAAAAAGQTRGGPRTGSYSLSPPWPPAKTALPLVAGVGKAAAGVAAMAVPGGVRVMGRPFGGVMILSDSEDEGEEGSEGPKNEAAAAALPSASGGYTAAAATAAAAAAAAAAGEHDGTAAEQSGAVGSFASQKSYSQVQPLPAAAALQAAAEGVTAVVAPGVACAVTSSMPALAAPKRPAGSPAVAAAAAAAWEPAFPGRQVSAEHQAVAVQQQASGMAEGDGSWADQGWSSVKL